MPSARAAYVHVPFCRHRCGYCNFTLVAGRDELIESYLTAIEREISSIGEPTEIDTLFFGGGTPTQLPAAQLRQLIETVRHWFPLAEGYEFSVEANPIDMTPEIAEVLSEGGVTRISLGAQSFDRASLQILERDHTSLEIESAFKLAREFANSVSVDLIFGVPGQTFDNWKSDLDQLLKLGPDHISTYGLTFEKGTTFWNRLSNGDLEQVEESVELEMYEEAIERLVAAGFEHYEVSNFARPGHRCRHNEAYWLGQPCFAFGPGASRYLDGRRETNHRSTTTYLNRMLANQSPVAESEQLDPEDVARERLVFGLRRLEGVDCRAFENETGYDIKQLGGEELSEAIKQQWLQWTDATLSLTHTGLIISDSIWPLLLRR